MIKDPHKRLLQLLAEVVAVARVLAAPHPAAAVVASPAKAHKPASSTKAHKHGNAAKSKTPGIYPHVSKYNPWRAYVWDSALKQTIYLGAFPAKAKALAAQQAYRKGQPVVEGTKTTNAERRGLRVVGAAA